MSDESEGEDDDVDEDYTRLSSFLRRHSAIEEVDEDSTEDNGTAPTHTPQPHQDLTLPEQEGDDMEALTATAPSFPALAATEDVTDARSISLPTPTSPGFAHSESTISTIIPTPVPVATPTTHALTPPRAQTPAAARSPSPVQETLVALPSPTASSFHSNSGAFHFSPHQSQHHSLSSVPSSAPVTAPASASEGNQGQPQLSQKKDVPYPATITRPSRSLPHCCARQASPALFHGGSFIVRDAGGYEGIQANIAISSLFAIVVSENAPTFFLHKLVSRLDWEDTAVQDSRR
ncbi:hypothetical protein EV361DRAFT_957053 [Lentinula raphanica]|nr:hypothetical protein EV361DRAFT_957053 [Lentinula raphanica]